MSQNNLEVAARPAQTRKNRAASLVDALANNPVFTAGAEIVQFIKDRWTPLADKFPRELQNEDVDMDLAFPDVPMPDAILEKLEECKTARKRNREFLQWMENKQQPAQQLVDRGLAAIDRLRERMEWNRQIDGPMATYNELGQRIEDIQRCMDTLDRDYELDCETLREIEDNVRAQGEVLVQMLEQWLADSFGYSKEVQDAEIPGYEAPFDTHIIDSAESACERRILEDEQEEAELRKLPFQPEDCVKGRNWVEREIASQLDLKEGQLRQNIQWLDRLKEIQAARADGDPEYGSWEAPEDCDFEELFESTEQGIESLRLELQECIDAGRSIGMDIDDEGHMNYDQLPAAVPDNGSGVSGFGVWQITWGEQEPDEDREYTEEEMAQNAIDAVEKVQPWLDVIDETYSPNYTWRMASPTHMEEDSDTGDELSEPTPGDSTSQPDHNRIDLGYSIYRIELNHMEELREKARSELPPDARPAKDDQPGCES